MGLLYVSASVKGGERLQAKLLKLIGPEAQDRLRQVNQKSANEFAQRVRAIIPQGDKAPHLADSIVQQPAEPLGVSVSIGGPGATPYPAHLEWGHRFKNGTVVPAKPFWFPTLRVMKKRRWGQINRAQKAAIRAAVAAGN